MASVASRFRSRSWVRFCWSVVLLLLLLTLTNCSTLGYYGQAAWGQTRILVKRQAIARLLASAKTPEELRRKLQQVESIRDFAVRELRLPDNGSYRSFVELPLTTDGGRPSAVVWNVVAAPELAIEPLTWCFPVAGCVSYRGYFSEARVRKFASKLRRDGYDVAVSGAAAYSTLGWFEDPVLSTVIDYPEVYLAGLLFHELAHQQVYVKGDTSFNESFATTVEVEGVRRWLASTDQADSTITDYLERKRQVDELTELLLGFRDRLHKVYGEARSDDWKRQQKSEILARLRQACEDLDQSREEEGRGAAGRWARREVSNADLASVGSYHELVPGFHRLLAEHDGDLEAFYEAVARLADSSPDERVRRLQPELQ